MNIIQKLGKKGITVVTAESMNEGMHILQNENGFDAIIAEMDGKNSEGINLSTKCYRHYPILLLGEDEFSSLPNRILNHSDSYIEKKHLNKHIIDSMLLAIDNWHGRNKLSA
jgi:DNA-binding NtrC family response regulator